MNLRSNSYFFAKYLLRICYISLNQTTSLIERNVQHSMYSLYILYRLPVAVSENWKSGRGSRRPFVFEKPILLFFYEPVHCTVHFNNFEPLTNNKSLYLRINLPLLLRVSSYPVPLSARCSGSSMSRGLPVTAFVSSMTKVTS